MKVHDSEQAAVFVRSLLLVLLCAASAPAQTPTASYVASPQAASGLTTSRPQHAQQAYFQTLATFLLNHDRKKAEDGFQAVTHIDPAYAPAWFNLGVFAEGDHDWPKAKQYFEQYLHVAPSGPDAGRAKGQLQAVAKYAAMTLEQQRQAEYDTTIERARAFLAAGLFREAIAEAGRAEASDASRWEAYAVVSLCMAKQHKLSEAQKFESLAVSHAPAGKEAQVQSALAGQIAKWSH